MKNIADNHLFLTENEEDQKAYRYVLNRTIDEIVAFMRNNNSADRKNSADNIPLDQSDLLSKNYSADSLSKTDSTDQGEKQDRTDFESVNKIGIPRAYSGPTPEDLKQIIQAETLLPTEGYGFDAVLNNTVKKILPNFVRPSSTGYMAHLHSPAVIESIAAELILSTFNQSMDSWDQSPVATEIEVETIRQLCTLFGYGPESDGIFTSGGSQSNQYGMTIARDWFCNDVLHWDVKKLGLPEDARKFRIYTSCISHFSIEKSAHLLGLGYNSVIKVPVDSKQRMIPSELMSLIEADRAAGNIPIAVSATIGTTDYGSIDPIESVAEIGRRYGLWIHADAAYGSGLILSEKYSDRIKGLHLYDSITVDFHKMFLLPISGSMFLLKKGINFKPFELHADYLNREEDEEDGYTNLVDKSFQTTRRFDALKVWISFQTRGKNGWSKIISTCVENAAWLYKRLKDDSRFSVVTEPEISSVVFRLNAKDETNKHVRRSLIHKEGFVIGQTVHDGRTYLKFTLLNPLVTHESLDQLLNLILKYGGF